MPISFDVPSRSSTSPFRRKMSSPLGPLVASNAQRPMNDCLERLKAAKQLNRSRPRKAVCDGWLNVAERSCSERSASENCCTLVLAEVMCGSAVTDSQGQHHHNHLPHVFLVACNRHIVYNVTTLSKR